MTEPNYFFISHASGDKADISSILDHLGYNLIPMWIDKPHHPALKAKTSHFVGGIPVGGVWDDAVLEALDAASGVLAFVSKRSLASSEFLLELGAAHRNNLKHPGTFRLLPIFLDDYGMRSSDNRLMRIQGFDLRRSARRNARAQVDSLTSLCQRHLKDIHALKDTTVFVGDRATTALDARRLGDPAFDSWGLIDPTQNYPIEQNFFDMLEASVRDGAPLLILAGSDTGAEWFTASHVRAAGRKLGRPTFAVTLPPEGTTNILPQPQPPAGGFSDLAWRCIAHALAFSMPAGARTPLEGASHIFPHDGAAWATPTDWESSAVGSLLLFENIHQLSEQGFLTLERFLASRYIETASNARIDVPRRHSELGI